MQGNSRLALDAKLDTWYNKGRRVATIYDIDKLTIHEAKIFYK